MNYTRRKWLSISASAMCALIAESIAGCTARGKRPVILLCSGWQTVNIGDIAHTPGLIRLIRTHLPQCDILLWPASELDRGVDDMILRHYPEIKIIQGPWEREDVKRGVSKADFLLHGSGPGVHLIDRIKSWHRHTGRNFGIFGVTVSSVDKPLRDFLQDADFIFTRETRSLRNIRDAAIDKPITGFAPDATFSLSIRDDKSASAFMAEHDLEEGKFICAVPRLRKTPYYDIYPDRNYSDEHIRAIETLNATHAETDHAKLRHAIIRWVRDTGGKAVVVPEMTYQLGIMDELLFEPLPDDVKGSVVCRRKYWLPDEAASLYSRARAVLSFECHSPIIAVARGTPAMYLRQPEDTIKGQMWYDLGFDNWVAEIEESTGAQIADTLLEIHTENDRAKTYLHNAMNNSKTAHAKAMGEVGVVLTS